ncbi:hypothetical protein L0E83_07445 [Marichromatium gracile]|uniref:hypothetical protein n=1 Tax=Marichromatium gracile TaxID=1048 RepID=UPI001F1EC3F3|nr:hypothetical protein [Marichromatium gracile]MCF1183270.1 hypothetical protein [Marichromatium gracile]
MSVRSVIYAALAAMILTTGCSSSGPIRAKQVVTEDAYANAETRVRPLLENEPTISARALAARKERPIRVHSAVVLIDDGGTMREDAPPPFETRAGLARALANRLKATLSHPGFDGRLTTRPIQLHVERLSDRDGWRPKLTDALTDVDARLTGTGGETALILLSRADRLDEDTVRLIERMQARRGHRLCVHLVTVGDASACFKLRRFDSCGSAVRDVDIATSETMAAHALRLFYGDPPDTDGDGIQDYRDRCPGTRPGTRINWEGCPFDQKALMHLLPDEIVREGRALPPPSRL